MLYAKVWTTGAWLTAEACAHLPAAMVASCNASTCMGQCKQSPIKSQPDLQVIEQVLSSEQLWRMALRPPGSRSRSFKPSKQASMRWLPHVVCMSEILMYSAHLQAPRGRPVCLWTMRYMTLA